MTELNPSQELSLIKVLTDFPNYFKNFQENYSGLLLQGPYIASRHPELSSEYNSLVSTASDNYNKLVQINSALNTIKNTGNTIVEWVKGTFGTAIFSGLGVLPLIIAGISAASAYAIITSVAKWFIDANAFAKKLDYIKTQEAKGATPQQAANMATQIFGEPSTETTFLGLPIKWLIVGAVLIFLGPPLINALAGRRK